MVHTEAIRTIRQACEARGIVAGVHCVGGEMAARRQGQGFRLLTVVYDRALVRAGGASELESAVRSVG